MKLHVFSLLSFLSLGCAVVFGSPEEYAVYRATRVDTSLEKRLGAADEYLRSFPNGAYADEVKAYFEKAEPLFFEVSQRDVEGLKGYLEALPKGPHGVTARRLLGERIARGNVEKSEEQVAFEQTQATLERAARQRVASLKEITSWLERFLDPSFFEKPLRDQSSELVAAFEKSSPKPRCTPIDASHRRCSKVISLPFSVATPEKREARELVIEISVDEDASGRPVLAVLAGPDLFARREEALSRKALVTAEERQTASDHAGELVLGLFEARVGANCQKSVEPPIALDLQCKGLKAIVRVGSGGADDRIEISSEPAP